MRGHLTDLILAANRAADLTTQMLAYAGKGRFIVAPVNVTQLIAEITTLVRASIPKTVNVRLDLDKSIPHVEADRNQLQQLVMNLIINGAEAMGDGRPGTIVVRTGTQELDETYIRTALPGAEVPAGEYLYIEVRDEGCGMDESTKARIFEPFFTTKFTGRGLGLAAALGIVKAHRGAIRVYSTPGEGSVFKVFFPTRPVKGRGEASQNTVTRETVLVADDEEIVRRLAKTALESHGYRVLLAANGREAIDLMREMPGAVAVAILDLTMPIVSGDEAMRELKKIQPGLPIILSSGYTEAEAMGRFETGEIAGFVKKPYTTSQLRATIRAALESAGSS
jgi:Signal transduction histidine kinase, nitrogen specific